jgi:transposase
MKQVTYVGLDVHKKSITAVFGPVKSKPESLKVANDPKGWNRLADRLMTWDAQAVYEASSCGFEVYDEMTERGWSVVVVAPSLMAKSSKEKKNKTDLKDATELRSRLLAHREAGASLPTVWVPPVAVREDRELVRRRLGLGEKAAGVKAMILCLLQIHKVRSVAGAAWTKAHVGELWALCAEKSRLGAPVKRALESQLRELEFLMAEMARVQKEVEALAQEARHQTQVLELRKVKGVGALTAMTFLTELGDVNRFSNRRRLANYLGLTPSSYESGEAADRKGHITRQGPPRIRKILNQAVWSRVRWNPEVKERFGRLAARTGVKKAIVAEMRKLGIELWHRAVAAIAA